MLIGVLGAGQLGRMLALAGFPLGARFLFVDPNAGAPAGQLAEQIVAPYDDERALDRLAAADVVTYEFESVPEQAARRIAERVDVRPRPEALRVAQDRLLEKQLCRDVGIPTASFLPVSTEDELGRAAEQIGFPAVLKSRRFGYDGKGQHVLREPNDVPDAWKATGQVPAILEAFVRFERELSVLAVRATSGETRFYPLVENHHEDGMLRMSRAPAPGLTPELQRKAEAHAARILERLDYVGVLALEMFEAGGELYANEMAPRVHNSGHLSIEAAVTSQFENHLRAILDLPLGSTEIAGHAAMINLVGSLPERSRVLEVPGAHVHFYGKAPRAGRKVGHVTVCAADADELATRTEAVCRAIGWSRKG